jgi:cell division protein FtsI/penicillin-binding protein 2
MKYYIMIILGLFLLLTLGCTGNANQNTARETKSTLQTTPTLPAPEVRVTQSPDAEAAARAYLDAWKAENYDAMYAMLTKVSQDALTLDDFKGHYQNVANEASLNNLSFKILSSLVNPRSAQVAYQVTLSSVVVGDVHRDTMMNLSLDDGTWRVQWDDAIILPELAGGNKLWMDYRIPARGDIYDREGHALVSQADAVTLGIETGLVGPDYEYDMLISAWHAMDQKPEVHPNALLPTLQNYRNYGWYLGLGEVQANAPYRGFASFNGAILTEYNSRFYDESGIAPHVLGYVSAIQAEEADQYRRQGYRIDQKVGRSGIEYWGEKYLSGKRGGTLYVVNAQGNVITSLAETEPEVADSIYTTLDRDYQLKVQRTLNSFRGAIVVLERDTGRVLAMASSPGFDPNAWEPANYNSSFLLSNIFNDEYKPLLNRATQGQYPLGSVFKLITIAAALESGLYTPETTYQCGYTFEELQGLTLYDWTWDHLQRGDEIPPSGLLTLPEGLMRSCNPFFWHIGLDLFRQGKTTAIADMARAYGLGKPTGIYGIDPGEEVSGQILDPTTEVDATNQAIGQGPVQVTPLQVARFVAALGNGGILYRPQVIERIAPPGGEPIIEFKPEKMGTLPISPANLKVIQDAMLSVTSNIRGTAFRSFMGTEPVAGKTGTAQDPPRYPHAWFAGYTVANKPNKPDFAAVVIVENQGEGADFAAPIFRALVDLYFKGGRRSFPWESQVGVIETPTPEITPTP